MTTRITDKSTEVFLMRAFYRAVYVLLLFTGMLLSISSPIAAQTRFATPDTAIDVSKYKTLEECMVLRDRLNRREVLRLPYWRDTVEYTDSESLHPHASPVFDTLVLCMSKFSVEDVDYENFTEYLDWITIFYDARRDADGQAVIDKKISMSRWDKNDTSTGRHDVIESVLSALNAARPVRWETYVRIAKMIDSPQASSPWETRMNIYSELLALSEDVGDTAVQKYTANKIIELDKTLSDKDKISREWMISGRYTVLKAVDLANNSQMLDSLKVSSSAYVSFRNSYWESIRGPNSDGLPNNVGEIAKPIVGDFWFRREGGKVARLPHAPGPLPEKGRINLVVFLDINCEENTPIFIGQYHRSYSGGRCLSLYPLVRRLAERYPSLQVIVVSLTDGFIGATEPMSPEEEAIQKSHWWLGTHKLPATLVVAEQKFFKLPAPDYRRIDELHENSLNYLFNVWGTRVSVGSAFLIDVDGVVLYGNALQRSTERKFNELLRVVTGRK